MEMLNKHTLDENININILITFKSQAVHTPYRAIAGSLDRWAARDLTVANSRSQRAREGGSSLNFAKYLDQAQPTQVDTAPKR